MPRLAPMSAKLQEVTFAKSTDLATLRAIHVATAIRRADLCRRCSRRPPSNVSGADKTPIRCSHANFGFRWIWSRCSSCLGRLSAASWSERSPRMKRLLLHSGRFSGRIGSWGRSFPAGIVLKTNGADRPE